MKLKGKPRLKIEVKAAAYLNENQDEIGSVIASLSPYQSPYWHIERARIGQSRNVMVELVANGVPVEKKEIVADGSWHHLSFDYTPERSSWIAIRIYGSAHTNPIFVELDQKPIIELKSAQWCRAAVDQCWKVKHPKFREEELEAARNAYEHARKVYDEMIGGF